MKQSQKKRPEAKDEPQKPVSTSLHSDNFTVKAKQANSHCEDKHSVANRALSAVFGKEVVHDDNRCGELSDGGLAKQTWR